MSTIDFATKGKHRQPQKHRNVARLSIASLGIGALAFQGLGVVENEAIATTTCPAGTTETSAGSGICEQEWTADGTWTVPTGATSSFEALLVGAGSSSSFAGNPGNIDYYYGGNGGEVKIVSFEADAGDYFMVTVGEGGISAGTETVSRFGEATQLSSGGDSFIAAGALAKNGTSAGAGAAGSGSGGNGGPGLVAGAISSPENLFVSDSRCFGGGGAIGAVSSRNPPVPADTATGTPGCSGAGDTPATSNGGGGGSVSRNGGDGIVIIRFSIRPPAPPQQVSVGSPVVPVVVDYSKRIVEPSEEVTVKGRNFELVTSLRVGGQTADMSPRTSTAFVVRIPRALKAGTYDLELLGAFGTIIEKTPFTIEKKRVKRLIPGFAGDSPVITNAVKKAIRATTNRLPGAVNLLCIGSTSNTRVTAFDKRLARDRATRACARAKNLIPELTTKIRIKPASGVGPRARNIKMVLRNY
jgi:hypothetical protein